MEAYTHLVSKLRKKFEECSFNQIPRSENNHADALANLASAVGWQARREVPIDFIAKPSISIGCSETLHLDLSPGWREPIIEYLTNRTLPTDKAEAQKLQHRATRYMIINGKLYKDTYY